MDTCFYIWKAWLLPPAEGIAEICNAYNVHRVAIKFLDGVFRYNSTNWAGDANLKLFVNILRANGIGVDGWGYHYPYSPGPQGDAIEERREKFQLETYLLDIEGEWKTDPNPAPEMRTLLDKVKVGGFACLANSYKFPTYHPGIPWAAMMEHAAIDGATPQVYWEQAHNPAAQLERSYSEYARYNKPFIPCGSAYGRGDWLPTLADFIEFRNWCPAKKIPRVYWWSLDWVILKNKVQEWMPALCGMDDNPPPPGDEDMRYKVITTPYLNVRKGAGTQFEIVGTMPTGTIFAISDVQLGSPSCSVWAKIKDGQYAGMYACLQLNASRYVEVV